MTLFSTKPGKSAKSLTLSLLAGTALCATFSSAALADVLPLFNTGVSNTGTQLSQGNVDTHWQVSAGPNITSPISATVTYQHPVYYATNDSRWIWANANGSGPINAPFTFRTAFDLTGFDVNSAKLSGLWGVDNTGSVRLNGAAAIGTGVLALNQTAYDTFQSTHAFTLTGGFVSGINYLEFRVTDTSNPGALNVSGLVLTATPVPEPETYALMIAGLGALAFARRKQAKKHLSA
jgi:hypothetical protein